MSCEDPCCHCCENLPDIEAERDEARECALALAERIWEYRHLQHTDQLKELKYWRKVCRWLKLAEAA